MTDFCLRANHFEIVQHTSVVDNTVSSSKLRTASVMMASYGRKRLLITCGARRGAKRSQTTLLQMNPWKPVGYILQDDWIYHTIQAAIEEKGQPCVCMPSLTFSTSPSTSHPEVNRIARTRAVTSLTGSFGLSCKPLAVNTDDGELIQAPVIGPGSFFCSGSINVLKWRNPIRDVCQGFGASWYYPAHPTYFLQPNY